MSEPVWWCIGHEEVLDFKWGAHRRHVGDGVYERCPGPVIDLVAERERLLAENEGLRNWFNAHYLEVVAERERREAEHE